jgi:hypothetical protein
MNNTVEEAIGGYIAEENQIAANSRLRRDDVTPLATTDQALLEGLARVLRDEPLVDTKVEGISCGVGSVYVPQHSYPNMAKAALSYMQQHVRPLVVALESSKQVISTSTTAFGVKTGRDAIDKALSALPPVLRGNAVLEKE